MAEWGFGMVNLLWNRSMKKKQHLLIEYLNDYKSTLWSLFYSLTIIVHLQAQLTNNRLLNWHIPLSCLLHYSLLRKKSTHLVHDTDLQLMHSEIWLFHWCLTIFFSIWYKFVLQNIQRETHQRPWLAGWEKLINHLSLASQIMWKMRMLIQYFIGTTMETYMHVVQVQ